MSKTCYTPWDIALNRLLGWEDDCPPVRDDDGRMATWVSNGMISRDPSIDDGFRYENT